MKLVGNIYCNWCGDPIGEEEKYARVRRGTKLFHYHNRNCNDCYVEWAEEEDEEKKKLGETKKLK